jgi:hypothetical protein
MMPRTITVKMLAVSNTTSNTAALLREVVEAKLIAAASDVFHAHNLDLTIARQTTPMAPPHGPRQLVAMIGFTASGFTGALGVMLDAPLVTVAADYLGIGASSYVPADLVEEMANQLLGSLKNKLLPYGPSLSMALPLSLRGVVLQFEDEEGQQQQQQQQPEAMKDKAITRFHFVGSTGSASVWLDAKIEATRVKFHSQEEQEVVDASGLVEGGDLLLF